MRIRVYGVAIDIVDDGFFDAGWQPQRVYVRGKIKYGTLVAVNIAAVGVFGGGHEIDNIIFTPASRASRNSDAPINVVIVII